MKKLVKDVKKTEIYNKKPIYYRVIYRLMQNIKKFCNNYKLENKLINSYLSIS